MIVACDEKYGIAKNGNIPWKIKDEQLLFKKLTTEIHEPNKQNAIIMGKKTAYTINRVLPNRVNLVLTNTESDKIALENIGFKCFSTIQESLDYCNNNDCIDKIFLIGGVQIYNWGLMNPNKINKILISFISDNYECDLFLNHELLLNNFQSNKNTTVICEDFIFTEWSHRTNKEEKEYLKILKELKDFGHKRQTRNAITYSTFGKVLNFDLSKSFPLLTTKKMAIKSIFEELKFFLLGQTNNKILKEKNVHIWDGNTTKEFIEKCNLPYEEDDLGPMYGYQWRYFNAEYDSCETDYTGKGFDQLIDIINLIKKDPFSRRILMTSYNPAQAKKGVLYPCHGISIQFYVEEHNEKLYLDCLMHQRSADSFLGVPFNIASYAMLVHFICNHINCTGGVTSKQNIYPGKLMMIFGDMHIYSEHLEAVEKQINREPFLFPQIKINYDILSFDNNNSIGSISNLEFSDIEILDYKSHEPIKAKMIA